jgi:hypothetical protein
MRHRALCAAAIVGCGVTLGACSQTSTGTAPATPGAASYAPAATSPAQGSEQASRPAPQRARQRTSTAPGLRAVHDPGEVTGSLTGPCRFRDGSQLPDPSCTPGSIDPAVTQANIGSTICRPGGYTGSVRPPEAQTERFKYGDAYPAYGVPDSTATELDHLLSGAATT